MFNHSKNFSSFAVNDLAKAKEFYAQVLGMEVKDSPMGNIELYSGSGNPVMVYPKPDHQPATFTVLNIMVSNIEETVDYLNSKAVTMEQYTGEIKTDSKGILHDNEHGGPTIAWFKDPAGNILSLIEL